MRRLLLPALSFACVGCFAATYEISFDLASSSASVIVKPNSGTFTEFAMPAWSPGDYRIVDFGKNITDVRFTRLGQQVGGSKTGTNSWRSDEPADAVQYKVATQRPGIFSENFRLLPNEVFVHGPAVFGYIDDRKNEASELRLTPYPGDGANVAIGLTAKEDYIFAAKNYDELIDSPFAMGRSVRTADFIVGGKLHQVAAFGEDSAGVALGSYVSVGQKIAGEALTLFGELPYGKYVFLFDFGGPGGGLEHANSARLAMWPGDATGAAGFIAHEYFHAFNVKRIRPKPLGPFDYAKPAITGTLWWMEGVTDYYADVITVRAGLKSRESLMRGLSSEYRAFQRDADRLKVSADESSRRVWEAKNSAGYGINYYTKGKLIGWILDLAIRGNAAGKRSLDDVISTLYTETKNDKPGFEEDRIRELCVKFGGDALGPIYDACVKQAIELPLDQVAKNVGMVIAEGIVKDDPAAKSVAGSSWPFATAK